MATGHTEYVKVEEEEEEEEEDVNAYWKKLTV
jgi:hypothetical protein